MMEVAKSSFLTKFSYLGPVYTMDHESPTMEDGLFPWSDLMVQLPWPDFLENQFTKPLGPSLGVNRMWIKKNDHAPRS